MRLREHQRPTSSWAARRGRGAAASSDPERALGKRCSPRHGDARSATWPRGNPGAERVEGIHHRAAPTRTRRPVCRQTRSAAQKVAKQGPRSQRRWKTRCAAQEAASADGKRRASGAVTIPPALRGSAECSRLERPCERRCPEQATSVCTRPWTFGSEGMRVNGKRAEGVARHSAVGEGKSSKGRSTTRKGRRPQRSSASHLGGVAREMGVSAQRNVVNRESVIRLQDAWGHERSKTAEGARNPRSGTAGRATFLPNEGDVLRGDGGARVGTEGRQIRAQRIFEQARPGTVQSGSEGTDRVDA